VWVVASECFNWVDSVPVMHWMIEQPQCDLAVAANIFWLGNPSELSHPEMCSRWEGEPRWEDEALLRQILLHAAAGRYSCRWCPTFEHLTYEIMEIWDYRRQFPDHVPPFEIPPALLGPFGERPPRSAYEFQKDPAVKKLFKDLWVTIEYAPKSARADGRVAAGSPALRRVAANGISGEDPD
jgi:hypothetical protein